MAAAFNPLVNAEHAGSSTFIASSAGRLAVAAVAPPRVSRTAAATAGGTPAGIAAVPPFNEETENRPQLTGTRRWYRDTRTAPIARQATTTTGTANCGHGELMAGTISSPIHSAM